MQTEEVRWEAFALSVPVGLLASAILVVNNVRDVDTDRRAGQAHPGGEARAPGARVRLFAAMVVVAILVPVGPGHRRGLAVGAAAAGFRSRWCLRCVRPWPRARDGPALNGALADTGRLLAVFSLLLAAGRAGLS